MLPFTGNDRRSGEASKDVIVTFGLSKAVTRQGRSKGWQFRMSHVYEMALLNMAAALSSFQADSR